jgi:hypothetical protein
MAKCSHCGAVETTLYINNVPVCLECEKKISQSSHPLWFTASNSSPTLPEKKGQDIEGSPKSKLG